MHNGSKWLRGISLMLALVMLTGMLTACSGDGDSGDSKDNPYSSVTEVGSEKELTAVRENLIKATETEGLGDITKLELYENGVRTTSDQYVQVKDNKKIYWSGDIKRVVNYPDGYILDIPQDWVPDYSLATLRVRYDTDDVSLIASHEDGMIGRYYDSAEAYLEALYLYVGNADYHKNNNVSVVEDRRIIDINDEWKAQVYRLKLEDCPDDVKDHYTYVDYFNDVGDSYHFMFKCVDDRDFSDVYMSFQSIYDKGAAVDTVLYPCENNVNWAEETVAYYEALREQTHIDWGLYSAGLQSRGWKITIPVMEKQLDYTFPVISEYVHFSTLGKINDFPIDFCNTVVEDGRMMQVSYQYTDNNNGDLTWYSPSLDIYRRTEDAMATLTAFAEGAAQLDEPFFFRLNNEMSTDWTSYCAMANMLDPDIFIETWITLYDLFTQTGANEYAMWVFNSQDHSYPPYNWCDYRCYMPQANYIDLIGLTAYGFGSEAEGTLSSFESLYDAVYEAYEPLYKDWPWIISEFGCGTSETEAKAQWVTDMFNTIAAGKYPQIKVAIWFNANDYDASGNITNEIVLQNNPAAMEAFKAGLELTQPQE